MDYKTIYNPKNQNLFVINADNDGFIRFAMLVVPESQEEVSEAVTHFLKKQDSQTFKNNTLFSLEMIRLLDPETYEAIRDKIFLIDTAEKLESDMVYFNITKTNDLTPVLFSFSKEFFDTFIDGLQLLCGLERFKDKIEAIKRIRALEDRRVILT